MKSQIHNQGELKKLEIEIEKDVVESFEKMAQKSNIKLEDLVVVALKRFRSSHSDYMDTEPKLD